MAIIQAYMDSSHLPGKALPDSEVQFMFGCVVEWIKYAQHKTHLLLIYF